MTTIRLFPEREAEPGGGECTSHAWNSDTALQVLTSPGSAGGIPAPPSLQASVCTSDKWGELDLPGLSCGRLEGQVGWLSWSKPQVTGRQDSPMGDSVSGGGDWCPKTTASPSEDHDPAYDSARCPSWASGWTGVAVRPLGSSGGPVSWWRPPHMPTQGEQ